MTTEKELGVKQLTCIALMTAAMLMSFRGFAMGIDPPHSGKGNERAVQRDDIQDPNLDGVVEVSFKIDNLGKVQILNINSTSPQLSDYVIKKLSKIQLEQGNNQVGKIIKYRFVFKKQA